MAPDLHKQRRPRTAIVTGGARGLGLQMALALARVGDKVAINDLRGEELASAAATAKSEGLDLLTMEGDLTRTEDRARLLDVVTQRLGPIDILVNNAGVGVTMVRPDIVERPVRFWELDEAVLDRFFAVNSTTPFHLASAVVHGMVERGWGRIVNVTTSLDTMLRGGMAGYGGSKAAIEAHTAIMAADLAGTGVTVNAILPGGPADTLMVPEGLPRKELIMPERLVPPIVWLTSEAADGVSGRRFSAVLWDPGLNDEDAAAQAGGPAAWGALGTPSIFPEGVQRV